MSCMVRFWRKSIFGWREVPNVLFYLGDIQPLMALRNRWDDEIVRASALSDFSRQIQAPRTIARQWLAEAFPNLSEFDLLMLDFVVTNKSIKYQIVNNEGNPLSDVVLVKSVEPDC